MVPAPEPVGIPPVNHRLPSEELGRSTPKHKAGRDRMVEQMFDTHATARILTDADLPPVHAGAITDKRLAALELRLIKWNVGTGLAAAGIVVARLN